MEKAIEIIANYSVTIAVLLATASILKITTTEIVSLINWLYKMIQKALRVSLHWMQNEMQSKYYPRQKRSEFTEIFFRLGDIFAWTSLTMLNASFTLLVILVFIFAMSQHTNFVMGLLTLAFSFVSLFILIQFIGIGYVKTRDTLYELRHKTWRNN